MRLGLSIPIMAEPSSHYSFDRVQFLPPPVQQPRIPIWVSAMARNERTLGRAGRWDGDIVVAVPAGTLPTLHDGTGATWLLYTDWLDALRELASTPAPRP